MIGNMIKNSTPKLIDEITKAVDKAVKDTHNKLIDEILMDKLIGKHKKELVQYLKEKYPEEFI